MLTRARCARYVEANPHTLIVKFFGCHSIKMYRRIIYFVVMENILLTEGGSQLSVPCRRIFLTLFVSCLALCRVSLSHCA